MTLLKRSPKALFVPALVSTLTLGLYGCNSTKEDTMGMEATMDGEMPVPAGYKSWPKFVSTIDKSSGHVREIYINKTGLMAEQGEAFPSGTVSVMEIYNAQKGADGKPITDAMGRFKKADLAKVFVMAKGDGLGAMQPEGTIDNGDWIYSAYMGDGVTVATSDFSGCRSCHMPLADDDYVARYDEHFDYKMSW